MNRPQAVQRSHSVAGCPRQSNIPNSHRSNLHRHIRSWASGSRVRDPLSEALEKTGDVLVHTKVGEAGDGSNRMNTLDLL